MPKKMTAAQKQFLKNYMKSNYIFTKGNFAKAKGVMAKKNCWELAADELNKMENGSIKSWQQWRKTWNGLTWDIRKKFTAENKERGRTGGGTMNIEERSAEVQEMMEICGKHYFEGDEVDEGGEDSERDDFDVTMDMEEQYLDSSTNEGSAAFQTPCSSRFATSTPKPSTSTVSNTSSATIMSNMNSPPPAQKPLPKHFSAYRSSVQNSSWGTTNMPALARNNRSHARRSLNETSDGIPRMRGSSTQAQLTDSLQIQFETLEILKSIDLSMKIVAKREV